MEKNRENGSEIEKSSAVAWMLRSDGTAFPVIQHIYASLDETEESLYAAEWLYQHTQYSTARELVLDFIIDWANQIRTGRGDEPLYLPDIICNEIGSRKYVFLTVSFINGVAKELSGRKPRGRTMKYYNCQVTNSLNQEFLRARYGGMYHTIPGCRDLYFRISSPLFDWTRMIGSFLNNFLKPADTVTILWDEESTGRKDYFKYKINTGSKDICAVPFPDFLEAMRQAAETETGDTFLKCEFGAALLGVQQD